MPAKLPPSTRALVGRRSLFTNARGRPGRCRSRSSPSHHHLSVAERISVEPRAAKPSVGSNGLLAVQAPKPEGLRQPPHVFRVARISSFADLLREQPACSFSLTSLREDDRQDDSRRTTRSHIVRPPIPLAEYSVPSGEAVQKRQPGVLEAPTNICDNRIICSSVPPDLLPSPTSSPSRARTQQC